MSSATTRSTRPHAIPALTSLAFVACATALTAPAGAAIIAESRFDTGFDRNPAAIARPDVILRGAGYTLVQSTGVNPGNDPPIALFWHPQEVSLSAGTWRLNTLDGAFATEAEVRAVLAEIETLALRAEYLKASDEVMRLDNVQLTAGPGPEPATWALMGLGLAAVAPGRQRQRQREREREQERERERQTPR
jgi:hypothetical protein